MQKNQIEAWALRVIDRVETGKPQEDTLVELKADWPSDHAKAARQIAGHANAARGDLILWLIGVDQASGVQGASHTDLSTWYPTIQSHFLEISPHVTDLIVPYRSHSVMALLFETDRAPYMVKNPLFGSTSTNVEYEVPWRYHTTTRTARRTELIRLLAPLQLMPRLEIMESWISVTRIGGKDPQLSISGYLKLYITPGNHNRIVYPFHKCNIVIRVHSLSELPLLRMYLGPPGRPTLMGMRNQPEPPPTSFTVVSTKSEAIVEGPGVMIASASTTLPNQDLPSDLTADITCHLQAADLDNPANLHATLRRATSSEKDTVRWFVKLADDDTD